MSTPDIVIVDNGKIRLEIKAGEPLINGEPAMDCWKRNELHPAHMDYLATYEGKACGCLLGAIVTEVIGFKKAVVASRSSGFFSEMVGREVGISHNLALAIESGFENFKNAPWGDAEEDRKEWKLGRAFGLLVRAKNKELQEASAD